MTTKSRAPVGHAVGRRKMFTTVRNSPKVVAARTKQLVEIADQCGDAKRKADEIGEGFLAFLLSMVVEETQATMRRTAANTQPHFRKKLSPDMAP